LATGLESSLPGVLVIRPQAGLTVKLLTASERININLYHSENPVYSPKVALVE